ncbi:MAG: sel1 repeat family protein [Myxococcales bacterium]|nr:sel1 repeat family protein [Myxococcales bacterium]
MIALALALAAQAADIRAPTRGEVVGLRVLTVDFGVDGAVATPEGLPRGYARACELGWTPGCTLVDLRAPGASGGIGPFLAEACEGGDALSCLPSAWSLGFVDGEPSAQAPDPAGAASLLADLCNVGLARACADHARMSWFGIGTAVKQTSARETLAAACEVGIGRACTELGTLGHEGEQRLDWLERGCDNNDPMGCVRAAELHEAGSDWPVSGPRFTTRAGEVRASRACRLGRASACADVALHLQQSEVRGARQRAVTLARLGCEREEPRACVILGEAYAEGIGVPADDERANDLFHRTCQLDGGAGCARLADQILSGKAEGFALSPRSLYERACELEDTRGCAAFDNFDRNQRRSPTKLVAAGYLRYLFFPTVRPYLGGSASLVAEVALPKVDAYATRNRLRLTTDLGAGDYTLGVFDLTGEQEDLSFFALDWSSDGDPWGVRVGIGSQVWVGAPYFGGTTEAWPTEPLFTYPYRSVVPRVDVMHRDLFGRYAGLQLSVAAVIANEQLDTVNLNPLDLSAEDLRGDTVRTTLSVFRDRHQGQAAPMEGARSELSAFGGITLGLGPQWGVVLTDLRAFPLIRSSGDRAALSLVTDAFVSMRGGGIPLWMEHHHTPRFSPNVGGWRLLRGYPSALMAGNGAARGGVELRWAMAEYHGLSREIGIVLAPWIEVGATALELTTDDLAAARWRSNGGGALTVTWRRHTSLRFEAIAVPLQSDQRWRIFPALTIEQALDPWD